MFTTILKCQKMRNIFKAWKVVVDATRFAPVFKVHAYAAAASRRSATNVSPASLPSQAASPSYKSGAPQIPWRS